MSNVKLVFAAVVILLMAGAIVHSTITFDNGNELQAIFDISTLAFTASFWAWLLILMKD